MNGAVLKNNPADLIETLRRSLRTKIDRINSDSAAEIKRIEDEINGEIENFRAEEQKKYDEMIAYEEGKASNLLSIELKKQTLEVIDRFIVRILAETSEIIRTDNRYAAFLIECITTPLKEITGRSVTICISPGDEEFSEMIMNEAVKNRGDLKIRIMQDESIITGGVMVIDDEPEVVFNNTVERIVYRKRDELKRIIAGSVKEQTDGVKIK
ncbi:MAG TPA: V-type ATP synthase subunit E family protein [Spirochaetota bacterium]|nr:V-type ATP synthase subunit E family protein [Spirochaetota bacterium]